MELNGRRVLVTGSRGFVGRHLSAALERLGASVVPFDSRLGQDVRRAEDFDNLPPVDLVFHLAALSFVPLSFDDPQSTYETNILGTLRTLEYCRRHRAKMIFASSYLYGNPSSLPVDESQAVSPTNPYAWSKTIGETLCRAYSADFPVRCVVLRIFNLYGEGQEGRFLVPEIIRQIKTADTVTLKDLTPRRDMLYVGDAVRAYLKAAEYSGPAFDLFNIGSGHSASVKEIAEKLIRISGRNVPLVGLGQIRPGEIADTVADTAKARRLLGWEPEVDLDEGLRRTYLDHK